MDEFFNLVGYFYTPSKNGAASCKVPLWAEEKSKKIIRAGFNFEAELHPNPEIGITTTITHEDMGDLAIVCTQNTFDWRSHGEKIASMIDKFDIDKNKEIAA